MSITLLGGLFDADVSPAIETRSSIPLVGSKALTGPVYIPRLAVIERLRHRMKPIDRVVKRIQNE